MGVIKQNKLLLLLFIFYLISFALCDKDISKSSKNADDKPPAPSEIKTTINNLNNNNSNNNNNTKSDTTQSKSTESNKNTKSNVVNGETESTTEKSNEKTDNEPVEDLKGHVPSLDSGAVKRAFYVFVGLSVIALAYMLFRSTRLRKGPAQMVRKYGILAHKQDIEMRPLPLDEDDEDDTVVFDASGFTKQSQQASQAS